ncbi:GNAT family N-acetyltransferase [Paracholeplasma manati]|uniref:GNAT family N-acetyltransferase n=1 Tax=Paracholeplasma manati TaxID=591373 RepID=A0ABT2Y8Q6_9MOLU|nr:GNAT family N-acetyltransferase [Paracholeplasma manati]MCV2232892.1 GNAT family N-acetyltransferase [Paracholeplasma manati]MDG0888669.1 GNAT family N-acetyltransferase [Paracholeplasma manati]
MFILVETKENIKKISKMSRTIWTEAYKKILSKEQIDYMLTTFLSVQSIKEQINTGYEYFIIKGDKPVGFAAIKDESDKVFLSKIYIYKEYRNQGFMRGFIDKLKERKKPIYLTVNKYNLDAIKAYQKMGFEIKKELITDIGKGYVMDDYVLELAV